MSVSNTSMPEYIRLRKQAELDSQRSNQQRNEMGQFATPPQLARDITDYALSLHKKKKISFLEPSCGSGSFISALLDEMPDDKVLVDAIGIEVDERFATLARNLWSAFGFEIVTSDYFENPSVNKASISLVLANPPYVRHHHLSSQKKKDYVNRCKTELGIKPSALSGLYLYFILLTHKYLAPNAVSAWLIPSEFLDTNYGSALREYLISNVTINRIHRFDNEDTQFEDALVSSAVLIFTNEKPNISHSVEFSRGVNLYNSSKSYSIAQSSLKSFEKWSSLFFDTKKEKPENYVPFDEYFKIRRGIATGNNSYFILPRSRIDQLGIRRSSVVPILPPARNLRREVLQRDEEGYPIIEHQLAVINPVGTIDVIKAIDPALARYLVSVDEKTLSSYLARQRKPWYKMEKREPAPLLMTYMGRSKNGDDRPFRFILNFSDAIATNVYLMLYPIGDLKKALESRQITLEAVYNALLSISAKDLISSGRGYGGGLRKMEPRELSVMNASVISEILGN